MNTLAGRGTLKTENAHSGKRNAPHEAGVVAELRHEHVVGVGRAELVEEERVELVLLHLRALRLPRVLGVLLKRPPS